MVDAWCMVDCMWSVRGRGAGREGRETGWMRWKIDPNHKYKSIRQKIQIDPIQK
jgi:hypothetical protein